MSALALFVSSFVVVFALGFQQLNVQHHLMRSAVATSVVIGLASLVQFKVLPGPTSVLDVLAWLAGGATGIVAAMKTHPIFMRRLRSSERGLQLHDVVRLEQLESVKERTGLEVDIAFEASIARVQSQCRIVPLGNARWFDTAASSWDPADFTQIDLLRRAVRYLDLSEALIHHPTVHSLVRFKP